MCVLVWKSRKLSRRNRPSLASTQTPEICIDEFKDEFRDESEDGYASDSTSDSASELESCADTEDTSAGQQSPPPPSRLHGITSHQLKPFPRAK